MRKKKPQNRVIPEDGGKQLTLLPNKIKYMTQVAKLRHLENRESSTSEVNLKKLVVLKAMANN